MFEVPVQLRELVKQRLAVAAEEIFALVEETLSERDSQAEGAQGSAAVTPLLSPGVFVSAVSNPVVGGAIKEFQDLHNIKNECEEELIPPPESAPPAGLTFPKDEDTGPEMELKILEFHSEQCTADESTQTDSKTEYMRALPSFLSPLPSSAPLSSVPLSFFPLPSSAPLPPSSPLPSTDPLSSSPPVCSVTNEKLHSLNKISNQSKTQTENPPKPFSCAVCSLQLPNRALLRRHSASHSTEELLRKRGERVALKNPFSCSVCRRAFCSSTGLKIHAKTHEKNKSRIQRKTRQQQAKTKALEELECPDLNQAQTAEENVLNEKTNEEGLDLEEALTIQEMSDVQHVEEPISKSENQVNENMKSPTPQMTKDLKVAVYRVDSVEKLLSAMTENMSKRQNCEEESQNTQTAEAIVPDREEYHCPFCDEVYYTEFSFRHHKFTHKDDFKCSTCGKRFKKLHFLQIHNGLEHMTQKTTKNKTFHSMLTSKRFQTAKQFQIQKMMHGKLKFQHIPRQTRQFKRCNKEFIPEELLKVHEKQHLEEGGHCKGKHGSCSLCKVAFSEERSLATHMLSHPEYTNAKEENKFGEGRVGLEVKSNLEECLESQEAEEKERQGQNQSVQKQSSEETDSSESEPEECYKNEFPCPHCKEVLQSRPEFRRHQFSHKDDLTCPFCEQRFKTNCQRKEHIKTNHIKRSKGGHGRKVVVSQRLFHCKRCPWSFWNKKDAVAHRAFHKTKKKKLKQVFHLRKEVTEQEKTVAAPGKAS